MHVVEFWAKGFDIAKVYVLLGRHMSAVETLSYENALVRRLVRKQSVPREFWFWLNGVGSTSRDAVSAWIDPCVLESVEEIFEPNLVNASERERFRSSGSESWIAAILGFANRRAAELKLNCRHSMIAISLLPLYRSLATRKLPEALQVTRSRLAELLVLIGIAQELGEDFTQLLDANGCPLTSPYSTLDSILNIDLETTGTLIRKVARAFNASSGEFEGSAAAHDQSNETRKHSETSWSDPRLLWQIAGELAVKKAEIVLPRQWVDVAIPWTSISDHWQTLTHRLTHSTIAGETDEGKGEPLVLGIEDEIVTEMIDDILAMKSDVAGSSVDTPCHPGPSDARWSSHIEEVADEEIESAEEFPETDSIKNSIEPSIPKIAIVAISSRTDTMFVNIMRRQVATARNSDHSVCLIALCVESDDVADRERIGAPRSNGLLVWQDRLVNWLAEHPQIHEPFAFITAEGQLVVALQDIERTVATNVIREGLVTALAGRSLKDQSPLAQVSIPARYFAGIGSAYPNAGFAAEQLIDATWRCLSAATNQGKATIKSIEVF